MLRHLRDRSETKASNDATIGDSRTGEQLAGGVQLSVDLDPNCQFPILVGGVLGLRFSGLPPAVVDSPLLGFIFQLLPERYRSKELNPAAGCPSETFATQETRSGDGEHE